MKKGYAKYVQRVGLENLSNREPMLGRWRGRQKCLNEHLGPMRKFLRSCVGRPWNKVYQELCEHVSLDNAVQNHVLTHIFDYVERHVELHGRRVIAMNGWRRGTPLPAGKMYVCPRSGLLKLVRPAKHRGPPRRICGDDGTQLHRRENWWWEVRVRKRTATDVNRWDVWLERRVGGLKTVDRMKAYGGDFFATSKRPLSREEVRRLYRKIRSCRRSADC
jgi:hypothetical protein